MMQNQLSVPRKEITATAQKLQVISIHRKRLLIIVRTYCPQKIIGFVFILSTPSILLIGLRRLLSLAKYISEDF